ncbi:MAG: peptide-methionine (R)-S-oxide reductase MsrB [Terracidiphilus sp.]|jgi:peptide-methionine (R)-S-oxide reductase
MANNPREYSEITTAEDAPVQQTSRRAFLAAAAGACGAAAFWAFRLPVSVVSASGNPGTVKIVQFSDQGKAIGKVVVPRVVKTDAEWRQQLSPVSYEVTRHAGTERAYSGSTWNNHERGIYRCICCDNAVFSSQTKFESGTGWPSFWEPIAQENVIETGDESLGMSRTEVKCRECDAHLGHVFDDGPRPTGLRYCMNSAAMKFVKS